MWSLFLRFTRSLLVCFLLFILIFRRSSIAWWLILLNSWLGGWLSRLIWQNRNILICALLLLINYFNFLVLFGYIYVIQLFNLSLWFFWYSILKIFPSLSLTQFHFWDWTLSLFSRPVIVVCWTCFQPLLLLLSFNPQIILLLVSFKVLKTSHLIHNLSDFLA